MDEYNRHMNKFFSEIEKFLKNSTFYWERLVNLLIMPTVFNGSGTLYKSSIKESLTLFTVANNLNQLIYIHQKCQMS